MPTSGLSLVGFLENANQALQHLQTTCIPDPDADLAAIWQAARAKLPPPSARPGLPDIRDLEIANPHIQQLLTGSQYSEYLTVLLSNGASFKEIEIDPLLAFQLTVDTERSDHHCRALITPPSLDDLLPTCLPVSSSADIFHASSQGQSIIIRSRSLNLRIFQQGPINGFPNVLGVLFQWTPPHVHVVRYEGRCYLHNGYHRAYGARKAGATHIPCIFRDVSSAQEIGAVGGFDLNMLTSGNPPTVSHFTGGFALNVKLRVASRIIQVNWSEHVMFEE